MSNCDFESLDSAVTKISNQTSLIYLADASTSEHIDLYPELAVLKKAQSKGIRIFVEFATHPFNDGSPTQVQTSTLERIVVPPNSHIRTFNKNVREYALLNVHSVNFTDLNSPSSLKNSFDTDLFLAKVAGFDYAPYGLNDTTAYPFLIRYLPSSGLPNLMISAAPLSSFVTQRFAPTHLWEITLSYILNFLNDQTPSLHFQQAVHPSYPSPTELPTLPPKAEIESVSRGVDWFIKSGMLPNVQFTFALAKQRASNPTLNAPPQVIPDDVLRKPGDGRFGVLEGYQKTIVAGGKQLISSNLRNDCTCETAMSFALRQSLVDQDILLQRDQDNEPSYGSIGRNLLNFAWFHSTWSQGWCPGQTSLYANADAEGNVMGLISWATGKTAMQLYYSDDNARSLLAGLATRGALDDARWDSIIASAVLANLRSHGKSGFTESSSNFQAYIWAVFLRMYDLTGFEPLLDCAQKAIETMMMNYPSMWVATSNGIAVQKARMLLPLAWLFKVTGSPKHEAFLDLMVHEVLDRQDPVTGAIREEATNSSWNSSATIPDNANYGTFEAPLNQFNSDPVSDLLYTSNFALLGLHEAAYVMAIHNGTKSAAYKSAEDRLANLLIRAQTRSICNDTTPNRWCHNELDGAFYRAFDYQMWEFWASDSDIGWGAWSVETGWTQSWITSVLSLRLMKKSLWEISTRGPNQDKALKEEVLMRAPYFYFNSADSE
eukprot:g43.t1